MASLQHKNVKSQKTITINFEYIFHFFCIFTTLFLLCFFPDFVLRSFSHLYSLTITIFSNSFLAFILLNAIIIFLFILSNQNSDVSSDTYNQFLKITTSPELVNNPVVSSPELVTNSQYCKIKTASELVTNPVVSSPELVTDKQKDNSNLEVRDLFPVYEETVKAVTETTTTTCCTTTVTKNGENKVSKEKCYRRVQSECYERSTVVADQRRDLKRFNTCLMKKKEPERKICYVEELSKEEFNRTVEEFIAKHKKMQRLEQQKTEEQLRLGTIKSNLALAL